MKSLPRLPVTVPSHKGPVPVVLLPAAQMPAKSWGYWDPHVRRILVQDDLTRVDQWHTLFHEVVHMALADEDVELRKQPEEAVCRAVSLWLVGQLRDPAGLLATRRRRV